MTRATGNRMVNRMVKSVVVLGAVLAGWCLAGAPLAGFQEPAQDKDKAKTDDKKKAGEKKRALPLKTTRKIEFTTDEGTWLSLDVSPDGATIVFELLGDLYTLPVAGGEATRLPLSDTVQKDGDTLAFDSQPRYSPDGKWIAFLSDRDGNDNLWYCKADGTEPKQLTRDNRIAFRSPAWSTDSQYVVVTKQQGGSDIWMYHIKGGSGVNITGTRAPGAAAPAAPGPPATATPVRSGAVFSPDGRFLYFALRTGGGGYNQMSFGWQIARRDMQSGEVDTITQADGAAVRPVISPDGRFLVYGTRFETQTGLRIRNLESGEDRWLKYPIQHDDMESSGSRDLLPSYAFLPGGRELVMNLEGKIQRINIANGEAHVIPFTAKVSQELGPLNRYQRRVEDGPVRSRLIQDASQSPDGKKIVFSAMTHLYTMEIPGGTPKRVTASDKPEFKPVWSPDGQWIAYVTWDHDGQGAIWKIRAVGGAPQQLTRVSAFYTDLAFSPDATRIVARRGNAWMREQNPSEFGGIRIPLDIVWLPADGGDVNMIVPARGLGLPHFTTDPNRIYFYSNQGLVSMRYDATDRKTHLRITGRAQPGAAPGGQPPAASDALISPDGHWVAARYSNQLFVTAVPQVGGDAPSTNLFSPAVPTVQITDIGADSFSWSRDGKTLTWTTGSTFFRRPFDSLTFEPKRPQGGGGEANADAPAAGAAATPKPPREQDKSVESFEVIIEVPRYKPQGVVALRGATVITMKGDEVIPNADIVVTDNRITAIGKRGTVTIPANAKQIDLKGQYITPGFVDVHAHYEMRTQGVLETPNWSYLANLAYGVTTGLDVQTSWNDQFSYTDLIDAGMMLGPRAMSTGPGVFAANDFQSAEATLYVLERYKKYYRNSNLKSYTVGNRKQRQWVVQACKELELTVTTEGALDLKLDLTHVIDGMGGNEHALPIVPLYRDVVELFAQAKTHYTPTLLVLYGGPWAENFYYETTEVHDNPKLARFTPHNLLDSDTRRRPWFRADEHSFPKTAAQAAKIQRAGGLVGVGGHGQLQGLGYHWEMWSLASGGMTSLEVLRAATKDGAEIIGLGQDLGVLEPGRLADMVIMTKDPLQDIHNTNSIRYVMKNGELYEGDTLDQLWPVEKKIPPFWWWNDKPGK